MIEIDHKQEQIIYVDDEKGEVEIRVHRVTPVNLYNTSKHLMNDLENWIELIKDKVEPKEFEEYKKIVDELIYVINIVSETTS